MTVQDDPRIFVLIFLLTFFMYVSGILYIEHLEAFGSWCLLTFHSSHVYTLTFTSLDFRWVSKKKLQLHPKWPCLAFYWCLRWLWCGFKMFQGGSLARRERVLTRWVKEKTAIPDMNPLWIRRVSLGGMSTQFMCPWQVRWLWLVWMNSDLCILLDLTCFTITKAISLSHRWVPGTETTPVSQRTWLWSTWCPCDVLASLVWPGILRKGEGRKSGALHEGPPVAVAPDGRFMGLIQYSYIKILKSLIGGESVWQGWMCDTPTSLISECTLRQEFRHRKHQSRFGHWHHKSFQQKRGEARAGGDTMSASKNPQVKDFHRTPWAPLHGQVQSRNAINVFQIHIDRFWGNKIHLRWHKQALLRMPSIQNPIYYILYISHFFLQILKQALIKKNIFLSYPPNSSTESDRSTPLQSYFFVQKNIGLNSYYLRLPRAWLTIL